MGFRIRRFARGHRQSPLVRRIARQCEKFLFGYFNEGFFEFDRNGALQEAYMLLEPFGYAIGRIYPDGVDFKRYEFKDDHFRTGNYAAIAADHPLKDAIAHFGHVG